MNPQQVSDQLIDTSQQLLPAKMDSAKARVMLLAIGLQESRFEHIHQIGGPAHGYWQFESGGGTKGVMTHPASREYARSVCNALGVPWERPAVLMRLSGIRYLPAPLLACSCGRMPGACLSWQIRTAPGTPISPIGALANRIHRRGQHSISKPHASSKVSAFSPHAALSTDTGVREDVVCSLRWDWKLKIKLQPELFVSVFVVPRANVKGRKSERIIVCNSVAQGIVEAQRGLYEERMFTYWRPRKGKDKAELKHRPVNFINNIGW